MYWSAGGIAHQVNIWEVAGVDALNPSLLLSLTTEVNLFRMDSFYMRLLVSSLHGYVFRHVRFQHAERYTERATTTTGVQFFRQDFWVLHVEELQVPRHA